MLNRANDRQPPTVLTRLALGAVLGATTLAIAGGALAAAEVTPAADAPRSMATIAPAPPSDIAVPPATVQAQATAATQAARAAVSGMIVDQLGGFLPGTILTLTNEATGGAVVGVTDRNGQFAFTDLLPGRYAVDVRLPGFQNLSTRVTLDAGATQMRTISMSVGSLEETITVTGTRGAPATAEPPRPAASRARPAGDVTASLEELRASLERATFRAGTVGGSIKAPTKTRHVNPIYPGILQSQGVEGQVDLIAVIGIDGKVGEVLQPRAADTAEPVHPDLVAAATAAVQQWEFTPTLLNGVPVPVTVRIHTQFSLR